MLLYYWVYLTWCEKVIKCSAKPHILSHFLKICFINLILHGHSSKILYINSTFHWIKLIRLTKANSGSDFFHQKHLGSSLTSRLGQITYLYCLDKVLQAIRIWCLFQHSLIWRVSWIYVLFPTTCEMILEYPQHVLVQKKQIFLFPLIWRHKHTTVEGFNVTLNVLITTKVACLSDEMFKKPLWQTVWTQIRLLL